MIRNLRGKLLQWYGKVRRELPWRATQDPYAIWVSEIMLQQTRVDAVIPYYHRFLERFPTIETLADAQQDEVLTAWSGLGYYRRAKLLHQAAQVICCEHDGKFPDDPHEALALPGIGRYTAGAILSIAFGQQEPVVDGNVIRVLTRIFRLAGDPTRKPLAEMLWQKARELVQGTQPGDLNQALMELGATVCLPNTEPRCLFCPVSEDCEARRRGEVTRYPELPKKPEPIIEHWAVALAERRGRFLTRQRRGESLMEGLWEFPTVALSRPHLPTNRVRSELQSFLQEITGLKVTSGPVLWELGQGISGRKVTQIIVQIQPLGNPPGRSAQTRWLLPREIESRGTTTATNKILRKILAGKAAANRASGSR